MKYSRKQAGKPVRKEAGLTPKEKETVEDVMHRNDKALRTLARM